MRSDETPNVLVKSSQPGDDSETDSNLFKTKILIIGGGVGGCGVALEYTKDSKQEKNPNVSNDQEFGDNLDLNLKKNEHEIMLVDAGELLRGTSNNTPGRAGLGFHYKHLPTAKMYLRATLNLVLDNQAEMVGGRADHTNPLKRGRYFITKDSQEKPEILLPLYEELRSEYAKYIKERPEITKIFGEAKDFFRVLEPEEYANDVNMDKIALGIETAEQLLDWPKFRSVLRNRVLKSNVQVLEQCRIVDIAYHKNGDGFVALTSDGQEIHATVIVNATWQNIESINRKLSFIMPEGYRTNRLKGLARVELPESLRQKSSMFFCMGPHCMFSNMGNGIGMMTYAPETNIENSTSIEPTERSKKYLSGKMPINEKMELGRKIIEGVKNYIPAMENAQLLDVQTGIVKTLGEVDIFSHNSKVHERDYSGVEEQQICFISNACMKLLYVFENGGIVSGLLERHLKAHAQIKEAVDSEFLQFFSGDKHINTDILKSVFLILIHRYLTVEEVENNEKREGFINTMFKSAGHKTKLNAEIAASPTQTSDAASLPLEQGDKPSGSFCTMH